MRRLCVLPKKSEGCGVVPWLIATLRGVATAVLRCVMSCALLVVAPNAWAQQDSTPVSKPKETVVVTGVYEPLPLGEVDRPITQLDIRSNELVSNSLEDFLRLDSSVDLQERGREWHSGGCRHARRDIRANLDPGGRLPHERPANRPSRHGFAFPRGLVFRRGSSARCGFDALWLRCRGRGHQLHHPPAARRRSFACAPVSAISESTRKAVRGVS